MPRRGENIRKRKDGRWEGRYIKTYDTTGKAKYGSVYASTYLNVKKKLNEAIEEASKNTFSAARSDLTFREVLFLWLQSKRNNLKDQTYTKYYSLISKHILPVLGKIKINNIDTPTVNRFIYAKSSNGRLDGGGGLSSSYIQTICFIISSTLDFSLKEGYRSMSFGSISRPAKQKRRHGVKVMSHKEQDMLEEYLTSDIDERKLGVLLSLRMGLRIGEVCGLRWEDVDLTERTVHVHYTVERITNVAPNMQENKTRLVLCGVKTVFSDRVIPIPSGIMPLMIRCKKSGGFVIPGKTYEYSDPRSFENYFHKYLDECNLQSFNYHCLRHTFATRCVEAGMDIKSLSEILGHSGVNITLNIYVHSSLEYKRRQLELVSGINGQKNGQSDEK